MATSGTEQGKQRMPAWLIILLLLLFGLGVAWIFLREVRHGSSLRTVEIVTSTQPADAAGAPAVPLNIGASNPTSADLLAAAQRLPRSKLLIGTQFVRPAVENKVDGGMSVRVTALPMVVSVRKFPRGINTTYSLIYPPDANAKQRQSIVRGASNLMRKRGEPPEGFDLNVLKDIVINGGEQPDRKDLATIEPTATSGDAFALKMKEFYEQYAVADDAGRAAIAPKWIDAVRQEWHDHVEPPETARSKTYEDAIAKLSDEQRATLQKLGDEVLVGSPWNAPGQRPTTAPGETAPVDGAISLGGSWTATAGKLAINLDQRFGAEPTLHVWANTDPETRAADIRLVVGVSAVGMSADLRQQIGITDEQLAKLHAGPSTRPAPGAITLAPPDAAKIRALLDAYIHTLPGAAQDAAAKALFDGMREIGERVYPDFEKERQARRDEIIGIISADAFAKLDEHMKQYVIIEPAK